MDGKSAKRVDSFIWHPRVAVESNIFVHFLRELKTPKRHFEINWPLDTTLFILLFLGSKKIFFSHPINSSWNGYPHSILITISKLISKGAVLFLWVIQKPCWRKLTFFGTPSPQWVRRLQKRNFGSWISPDFVVLVNSLGFK